jgi:hypothetical protein
MVTKFMQSYILQVLYTSFSLAFTMPCRPVDITAQSCQQDVCTRKTESFLLISIAQNHTASDPPILTRVCCCHHVLHQFLQDWKSTTLLFTAYNLMSALGAPVGRDAAYTVGALPAR